MISFYDKLYYQKKLPKLVYLFNYRISKNECNVGRKWEKD